MSTTKLFSDEHSQIYFGEDDGNYNSEASNDFRNDNGNKDILNPLIWYELYNRNNRKRKEKQADARGVERPL